ncbi:MAG TPA: ABC transporter substrate-binding protein [Acholeplasma sp.]|nr:ABC transporter substrate-binding protein [Acholeplasma sp.]
MKKVFTLLLLALFVFTVSACGDKTPVDDRTVITYAAWNLGLEEDNNIERRMIDAFMEKYPDIRVDVIERPRIVNDDGLEEDATWDQFFSTQAAIGKMPDVFQVDNVVKSVLNEWAEDISAQANADAEFLSISEDIRNDAQFGQKLFALPQAMFYMGYFINRTIIDERNANTPTYGITYDDLMAIAQKAAKPAVQGGDGIAGIDGVNNLIGWLPAQYDSSLGWYTYNETGYHLDSTAFQLAMTEQQKYFGASQVAYTSYVLETQGDADINGGITPEDRYGTGSPFENSKQAIKWEGSYNLRNWLADTLNEKKGLYGKDIDFIGTPSVMVEGVKVNKIPVILDYIAVGQGTKQIDESYLFAKWMGFGVEGYTKRLEIARANPEAGAVNFAPIVPNAALVDKYFELYPTLVEFEKIVRSHEDFIIESLAKTVPGYVKSRWEGRYSAEVNMSGALDLIRDGELSLADALAAGLNTRANTEYNTVKAELDALLK